MKRQCIFLAMFVFACSAFLTSCGGKYVMYDSNLAGGAPPAILVGDDKLVTNTRLYEIDGKKGDFAGRYGSSFDGSFHVELTPGEHTLLVGYHDVGYGVREAKSTGTILVAFSAESGHRYKLGVAANEKALIWTPVLTDLTTGEMVYPEDLSDYE